MAEDENKKEQTTENTETEGTKEGEETSKDKNEKQEGPKISDNGLNVIYEVPVNISAVIGCAKIKVNQLLKLGRGAIIELDKKVGDPVDIYVNNRLVAMGEIVIVDGNIGITMTEIVKLNA